MSLQIGDHHKSTRLNPLIHSSTRSRPAEQHRPSRPHKPAQLSTRDGQLHAAGSLGFAQHLTQGTKLLPIVIVLHACAEKDLPFDGQVVTVQACKRYYPPNSPK